MDYPLQVSASRTLPELACHLRQLIAVRAHSCAQADTVLSQVLCLLETLKEPRYLANIGRWTKERQRQLLILHGTVNNRQVQNLPRP